jgi:hypothetical protein
MALDTILAPGDLRHAREDPGPHTGPSSAGVPVRPGFAGGQQLAAVSVAQPFDDLLDGLEKNGFLTALLMSAAAWICSPRAWTR